MLLQERMQPDLVGHVQILAGTMKRTFVVEVKNEPLKLKHIYQTKRYAEVLSVDDAFLISPEPFSFEREAFLKNNLHILSFSAGYLRITVMKFNRESGTLEFIESLKGLDPFKHV